VIWHICIGSFVGNTIKKVVDHNSISDFFTYFGEFEMSESAWVIERGKLLSVDLSKLTPRKAEERIRQLRRQALFQAEKVKRREVGSSILEKKLDDFDLSVRVQNTFKGMEVYTIGDLVKKTELDLIRWRNFGRRSLEQVVVFLDNLGLSLDSRGGGL